jgi:hypothetical protein
MGGVGNPPIRTIQSIILQHLRHSTQQLPSLPKQEAPGGSQSCPTQGMVMSEAAMVVFFLTKTSLQWSAKQYLNLLLQVSNTQLFPQIEPKYNHISPYTIAYFPFAPLSTKRMTRASCQEWGPTPLWPPCCEKAEEPSGRGPGGGQRPWSAAPVDLLTDSQDPDHQRRSYHAHSTFPEAQLKPDEAGIPPSKPTEL